MAWEDLPEYDDKNLCPACQYDPDTAEAIQVEYQARIVNGIDQSTMNRRCPRCGHGWQEKPIYLVA